MARFSAQLHQEILAQREREKEKGELKDGGGFRRDCLVSTLIPRVGQQADSGAWDMGRHHSTSPCLTRARGSFSGGSSKPGIRPVVNRCQKVQQEDSLIHLHGKKNSLCLCSSPASTAEHVSQLEHSCYSWSSVITA